MNIQDVVGPVDIFSAAVVIAFGVGFTVIATTALARTPRKKLDFDFDFELAKITLANANADAARNSDVNREVKLGQIAANRQIEVARIEGGMVDVKNAQPAE